MALPRNLLHRTVRPAWTAEEVDFVGRALGDWWPSGAIAKHIGRSQRTIRTIARKHGFQFREPGRGSIVRFRLTPELLRRLREMTKDRDMNPQSLARVFVTSALRDPALAEQILDTPNLYSGWP
jgi:hypothetical protein